VNSIDLTTESNSRENSNQFEVGECWGYNRLVTLDELMSPSAALWHASDDRVIVRFAVRAPTYFHKCRVMQWSVDTVSLQRQPYTHTYRHIDALESHEDHPAAAAAASPNPPSQRGVRENSIDHDHTALPDFLETSRSEADRLTHLAAVLLSLNDVSSDDEHRQNHVDHTTLGRGTSVIAIIKTSVDTASSRYVRKVRSRHLYRRGLSAADDDADADETDEQNINCLMIQLDELSSTDAE
jgi:hypothetical protein